MRGGQYPATAIIDYLTLAASQVGEARAQLDAIVANIEQIEDRTQVVWLPLDYSRFITNPPYNTVAAQEAEYPDGDWRSIIILYPTAEALQRTLAGLGNGIDMMYTASSGFTGLMQPMPTAFPVFGDQWGRLCVYSNPTGGMPVWPAVPAILSTRNYYSRPTYAGY